MCKSLSVAQPTHDLPCGKLSQTALGKEVSFERQLQLNKTTISAIDYNSEWYFICSVIFHFHSQTLSCRRTFAV